MQRTDQLTVGDDPNYFVSWICEVIYQWRFWCLLYIHLLFTALQR